ncbi:MAG: membrane protein insertion efficiency factor YidD, partial [Patescibacteria group bacterium]|nr:membrane protein insertion efficiency factor YidD [Patescibacteria group bacterium]
ISFYQVVCSPIFAIVLGAKCRYSVPCSMYAKEKIKRYGIRKGGYMAFIRLLSCQPFARIQQQ